MAELLPQLEQAFGNWQAPATAKPTKDLTVAIPAPKSRIVVTEAHGRILGLLVDAVLQVTRIPADAVQPPPEDIRTPEADWLAGVARRPDRLLILLDLDAVLLLQR